MIIKDYFIDKIKKQYKDVGNKMYMINAKIITDNINDSNSDKIVQTNLTNIEKGKFYFMFYDLSGKTSKMEKFNPLFVIDWFDIKGTRMLYAVSINFMPVAIRTIFFNSIINFNLSIMNENENVKINNETSFKNINFSNIYKLLKNIGFEWCIREFDMKLINNVNLISTKILPEFISMSTAQLTGVDDSKLLEIWQKKLSKQDERERKMIADLLNDFKTIEQELNKTKLTLSEKNDNLQTSLNIIKKKF
jgi:DNA-binding ferritin-like protein